MRIFSLFIVSDSVWKWIRRLGGPGLILLGLADNTPFISAPAGSEDVFLILLSAHHTHGGPITLSWLQWGRWPGAMWPTGWPKKAARRPWKRKWGNRAQKNSTSYFEKRGFMTVFTGSILPPPFPFTSVLMAAGVMQYPNKRFLSALTAGRALRFFTVAYLSKVYGRQMIGFFSRHYQTMLYALIALAVMAGMGALVYFKWYRSAARPKGPDKAAPLKIKPGRSE